MTQAKGLLLVTMEPPAGLEDEFNDWYDTEHFPQRRSLPGIESASRWVCLHGWPRWVALYDLDSVAAMQTPEYLTVSGPNSTPWSRRILPRTVGRSRVVAERVMPGNEAGLPPESIAHLVIARYGKEISSAGSTTAAAALPGLAQSRLFRATDGQYWAIAAYDRPQSPEAVRLAFGAVDGAGALQLNIYAPYHRG
jgi:hypothetical protein